MPKSLKNQIRESEADRLKREYLTMADAMTVTGFSSSRVLTWAEENNVHHYKYVNKWYFKRADVARVLQQDAS